MKKKPSAPAAPAPLRRRAEDEIQERLEKPAAWPADANSTADTHRLLHELQVHQVELEMQNAELRHTRDALEASLENYTDLYDFAPVGYFTLTEAGLVRMVNLTGAGLAGTARSLLIGKPFRQLLPGGEQAGFDRFLAGVLRGGTMQSVEYEMDQGGGAPRVVSVVAQPLPGGKECRVAVVDITGRRLAEQTLQENESRLRYATDSARLTYVEVDLARGVARTAENFAEVMGYPPQAEQEKDVSAGTRLLLEHVIPCDRPRVQAALDQFTIGQSAGKIEYRVLGDDGIERWIESRWSLERSSDGRARKSFATNLDITERKRAETALRGSEARFRAAVEIVTSLIWTNNAAGLMKGEQPGWGNFTGQSEAEYQGFGWAEAVHPEDAGPTIAAWELAVAGKRLFEFEHRVRRHDGEWRFCAFRAVPMFDEEGRILEWVGVHTDLTERQQAETALRVSEEFNRSVIMSSPDCIKLLDPAGNLLSFLHGAEELMGITDVRPFLNKPWTAFWEGVDRQAARKAVAAAAAGGEGSFVGFFRTFRDEPKWWDVRISPISDAGAKPTRLLAVSRDVTEGKRTELNAAFLASVSLDLMQFTDVDVMLKATGAKICAYLDLSVCAFIEIDEGTDRALVAQEWHQENVPSLTGSYNLAEFVGEKFIEAARAGTVIPVGDTGTDPRIVPQKFESQKIASFVLVPMLREGQWRFSVGFYRTVASIWQESEIELMSELASRIWTRLERLRVVAALLESEERYRTLFNSIDEGFCLIDMIFDSGGKAVDWRFLEVNPSVEKQTGLHDITGRRMREILPDHETYWFETYGKVALTGEPVRFINEAKGMGESWFDLYAFRVGGPESRKVAVIFTNITARRNTERELSEKARLLDLTHDAIVVRDMEGHIQYWNHGAEELYGWSRAEALGKVSHHLLRTEFPTPVEEITEDLHRTGRWTGELIHRKRGGRKVTVLIRKTLDRDEQGNPAAVLENITDITGRKEAEAVQRRLEVMTATNRKLEHEIIRRKEVETSLKRSEQEQGALLVQARHLQQQLRGMSHQMLNVQEEERKRISRELHDVIAQTLIGINVHVAALGKGGTGNAAEFQQKIARTQRLVEQSVEIVHQFATELRPTVLDDLGLIPALRAAMVAFMAETGVRVSLKACAGVEHCSDALRTVIYRVAQEALTNVGRHAGATSVEVTIQSSDQNVSLQIKDDGHGFALEGTSGAKKNQRLGLLGMKERVEMVGGTLRIISAQGQPTTILAEFPLLGPVPKKRPGKNARKLPPS